MIFVTVKGSQDDQAIKNALKKFATQAEKEKELKSSKSENPLAKDFHSDSNTKE